MRRPVKIMLWVILSVGSLLIAGTVVFSLLLSPCCMDSSRAKRMDAKANMHTVQLALEYFALETGGIYPASQADTTPSGETLMDLILIINQEPLENPYTGKPLVIRWDEDPSKPGEIAIAPADSTGYVVKGYDNSMPLALELTTRM